MFIEILSSLVTGQLLYFFASSVNASEFLLLTIFKYKNIIRRDHLPNYIIFKPEKM